MRKHPNFRRCWTLQKHFLGPLRLQLSCKRQPLSPLLYTHQYGLFRTGKCHYLVPSMELDLITLTHTCNPLLRTILWCRVSSEAATPLFRYWSNSFKHGKHLRIEALGDHQFPGWERQVTETVLPTRVLYNHFGIIRPPTMEEIMASCYCILLYLTASTLLRRVRNGSLYTTK